MSSASLFFFLHFPSCFTPSFSSLTEQEAGRSCCGFCCFGALRASPQSCVQGRILVLSTRHVAKHKAAPTSSLNRCLTWAECIQQLKATSKWQGCHVQVLFRAAESPLLALFQPGNAPDVLLSILNPAACHFLNGNFTFSLSCYLT